VTDPTTVMCPECGELVEIKDVQTLVLTLHQANECDEVSSLIVHRETA
jgi:hypothetical protein